MQTPKSPMPRHRGGNSRSRPNRHFCIPDSPDPGQIGIPRIPGQNCRQTGNRGKILSIFPTPAQLGSGKSRLFSRPNRGGSRGAGVAGIGDYGVWAMCIFQPECSAVAPELGIQASTRTPAQCGVEPLEMHRAQGPGVTAIGPQAEPGPARGLLVVHTACKLPAAVPSSAAAGTGRRLAA